MHRRGGAGGWAGDARDVPLPANGGPAPALDLLAHEILRAAGSSRALDPHFHAVHLPWSGERRAADGIPARHSVAVGGRRACLHHFG